MSDSAAYVHAARGQTQYNGSTINTSDLAGVHQEGFVRKFPNLTPPSSGAQVANRRSGGVVVCRWMRNASGQTLLPKRLVTHQDGYYNKRFIGYSRTTAQHVAGVIDEFLPSTGVVNNDCCWVVQQGQTLVVSDNGNQSVDFTYGAKVYASTAATSASTGGLTTGGKFNVWAGTFTSTQTTDGTAGSILFNSFGRCASTAATTATNTDTLIEMNVLN